MKNLIITFAIFIVFSGCSQQYSSYNIDSMFSDVAETVKEANLALSQAEDEVLKTQPDNIIRPDPDASKCPCKGTGLIKQGDGHVTQCPYHSKTTQILKR